MVIRRHILAAATAAFAASANAALVVDTFDDPNPGDQTAIDTRTSGLDTPGQGSSYNGVGIFGNQRDIYIIKTGGPDSSTLGGEASVANGNYAFSSPPGHGAVGIIRWDGMANTGFNQSTANSLATNLNNAIGSINGNGVAATDFVTGTDGAFVLDVLSSTAGFNVTLQAFSNSGTQFSQLTVTSINGAGEYLVPFAAFSGIPALQCAGGVAAGCADFTQVTALQMIINFPGAPVPDTDLTLAELRLTRGTVTGTVPEPGMAALAGVALLAAASARRRARAARPVSTR